MKFILVTLITSFVAAIVIKFAEHIFGVANVYSFAVGAVCVVGIIVVPFIQLTK
jgi:hypothetical protein